MPLYGERANALCRLQETISQQTSDLFLFAWYYESFNTVSLFARSPTDFSRGTTVQSVEDHIIPAPFIVQGNMGIQFTYLDERQMKDQKLLLGVSRYHLWHLGCKMGPESDNSPTPITKPQGPHVVFQRFRLWPGGV